MSYSIRRATRDDAEAIARHYEDESAYSGTLQLPHPSIDVWRERLTHQDGVIHLVASKDAALVGNIGLHTNTKTPRRAHAGSIGMAVPSAWQRKGVGTALLAAVVDLADNWYGLARLELTVYTDNEAAIALYRKLGFEHEGTLRAYSLRQGLLADAYTMARIRNRPQPA